MTALYSKGRHEKLAITVHVLQKTYDFVISRCCSSLHRTEKKCTKTQNARAEALFCSLNCLFREDLIAVAVVVCSLLTR